MTPTNEGNGPWARALLLPAVALGAVALVCVPFLAALVLSSLLPGVGELRPGVSGWSLLHLLWIYPATYVLATLLDPLLRPLPKPLESLLGAVLPWAALTGMFLVFFVNPAGAGIAAALSMLLLTGFVRVLQRSDDPSDARTPAGP